MKILNLNLSDQGLQRLVQLQKKGTTVKRGCAIVASVASLATLGEHALHSLPTPTYSNNVKSLANHLATPQTVYFILVLHFLVGLELRKGLVTLLLTKLVPGKCSILLEVTTIVQSKVMVHRTVFYLLALTFTHHFGLLDGLLDEITTPLSLNGLVSSAHAHVRSADITRVRERSSIRKLGCYRFQRFSQNNFASPRVTSVVIALDR